MQDYFLESRGIAYRTNGIHPTRKTLVFVHGLSGSASSWADHEERFEKDFNIVTFDLRGHALSLRPRHFTDYAIEQFADDLHALLEHLGVPECTLISHSFGTLVARKYMARFPTIVSKTIFLAAPYQMHNTWVAHTMWLTFAARRICELWPLPLPRGRRLNYKNWGYSPDFQLRRIAPEIYQMGLRSYLRCLCRQYADQDQGWEYVTMPSVLVHGSNDTFVPVSQAHALHAVLPNSKLHILPGANHMLVINNTPEIAQIIADFVR